MKLKEKKIFLKELQFIHMSLYFFIICFSFCLCDEDRNTDFDYQLKKRLNNGNYLILSTQGIYLYNEEFTVKKEVKVFESRLVEHNYEIYSADIAQFLKEDHGYIICLMLNETYIVSKSGEFLYHFSLDFTKIRVGNKIIPYGHLDNNYYFAILTLENKIIHIRKYIYNSQDNRAQFDNYYHYSCPQSEYNYLACELMKYNGQNVIYCFYGQWNGLFYVIFETNNFTAIEDKFGQIPSSEGGQLFISSVNSTSRQNLICCTQKLNDFRCFGYNIEKNVYTQIEFITENDCKCESIEMQAEYFPESDEFLVGCKSDKNNNAYYIGKLDSNNLFKVYNKTENVLPSSECTKINLFHFIFYSGKYTILTDSPDCQERIVQLETIDVIQIHDYPTDEIPVEIISNNDEPFVSDTSIKCHTNCKTCYEEGTDEDNKCLTCPDEGPKYLEFKNCVSSCSNDKYFQDLNDSSIIRCKCNNTKCLYCSKESLSYENNLCIICNTEDGYYPKNSESATIESYINCYKDLEGHYLENNIYKPCFNSCKNCIGEGDITNNNCSECIDKYEFKYDLESKNNNCYEICKFYYYYDSQNDYKCTNENSCPVEFSKLINGTNRCVDDCNKYNLFEYNNNCYNESPPITDTEEVIDSTFVTDTEVPDTEKEIESTFIIDTEQISDSTFITEIEHSDTVKVSESTFITDTNRVDYLNCELIGQYYNYNRTGCIKNITPGYYCNNTIERTIDKCHENCETCDFGGNDEYNNCTTCPKLGKKYFDLGNCVEECNNGDYVDNSINKCKCSTNITCEICSKESNKYNLCDSCKIENNYYPLQDDNNNFEQFINCYNEDTIKRACLFYYYFNNSKYYCTKDNNCPDEFKFLIEDQKKCIDFCRNETNYKYQYANKCYEFCPFNLTASEEDNYNCRPKREEEIYKEVIINEVNQLIDKFPKNNSCENNYIDIEENDNFTIYIYQNYRCPESSDNLPIIDFGECYKIIKELNDIDENEELIVSKIVFKINSPPVYSFYDPITLEKLDSTPCNKQQISTQEDINKKIIEELEGTRERLILDLLNQGINVFNVSHEFYTDICFHYNSPTGKDVPIKARLKNFFPNIVLCEYGCENVGVDIQTMKAKCECKFIDIANMGKIGDNLYAQAIQEIFEIISELNLAVVKCFKDIFKKKYFLKNTGGFIIISLFVGKFICFIKFAIDGLYYIRKYIFELTKSYLNYIELNSFQKNINFPPLKKKRGKRKIGKEKIDVNSPSQSKSILLYGNFNNSKKKIIDSSEKRSYSTKSIKNLNLNKNYLNQNSHINNLKRGKKNISMIYKNKKNNVFNMKFTPKYKNNKIDMKEYLSISFDENDFDDVVEKEKRPFCKYFCEKFKMNQIFINTFYINDPFRPKSLKTLVLIMMIELYFVINAIFYNEDYLSDLFNSNKKEKWYSFIPRRFNEFIYTSAVSSIIYYFVGYVFVEEEKIKKIFRRNKDSEIKMKYEISVLVKDIEIKFRILIILCFLLSVVCFVYISCFNNVYPCIKMEWIKSSLFILALMQIINLFCTLLECIFRYLSIKCNSEKIFKLSQLFTL